MEFHEVPSRRDILRALAYGAVMLPVGGSILSACSSDGTPSSTATTALLKHLSQTPTTVGFDSTKPWWLQQGFAPVQREVESTSLTVTGTIPPALTGLYVRNGSNPSHADSSHWFFGDGMVHGVRLDQGKATWYRNRYVQTPLYKDGVGFGGNGAPGGLSTQSNVSAIWHAGKLLTSGEVGYPFEISPNDLSTIGPHDFGGKLKTAFTAHPKIDPTTGNMHFFGYGFTAPFLTYHVADKTGALVSSQVVDVGGPTMIHDFAITEHDAIFWELPVVFNLPAAIKWIKDPKSGEMPFQWKPSYGARIGIMPLGGPTSDIVWHPIDPCYVFHGVNAYRDGNKVVIDVCRLDSMFKKGQKFAGDLSLRRWTVDTVANNVHDEIVIDHQPGELPTRDPRIVGRKHRYGYFVQTRDSDNTVDFGGLVKHDYQTGERVTWDPGPNVHSGEWLFVPEGSSTAQDAGWLLTFVYDAATDRSNLSIIDATDVARGPVATIAIPQRVPYGFHGTWVPAT